MRFSAIFAFAAVLCTVSANPIALSGSDVAGSAALPQAREVEERGSGGSGPTWKRYDDDSVEFLGGPTWKRESDGTDQKRGGGGPGGPGVTWKRQSPGQPGKAWKRQTPGQGGKTWKRGSGQSGTTWKRSEDADES